MAPTEESLSETGASRAEPGVADRTVRPSGRFFGRRTGIGASGEHRGAPLSEDVEKPRILTVILSEASLRNLLVHKSLDADRRTLPARLTDVNGSRRLGPPRPDKDPSVARKLL